MLPTKGLTQLDGTIKLHCLPATGHSGGDVFGSVIEVGDFGGGAAGGLLEGGVDFGGGLQ